MQQEPVKAGGFLSKVLDRVKGAGEVAEVADVEYESSRQTLTLMAERRRHNETIRMQEFAQLRQLRRQGRTGVTATTPPSSGFQSSVLDSDVRAASTLKKIDAIEAQMAQQWWRPEDEAKAQELAAASEAASTEVPAAVPQVPAVPHGLTAAQWQALPILGPESMVVHSAFAESENAIAASPELEEAAILFANGDIDSAKARLLELLVQGLDAESVDNVAVATVWHAVLDLYRATGDEEGFEPLAIDYAAHFGRSAPLWFSLPGKQGLAPLRDPASLPVVRPPFVWTAPATLTVEAVLALEAEQSTALSPWRLDWTALRRMDEAALPVLGRLLMRWASQPGEWIWGGIQALLTLLQQQTPLEDRSRQAQWWALRLAVLRMLNLPEAFDQVALDYCVTYEVSPPAWEAPKCHCQAFDGRGIEAADSLLSVLDGAAPAQSAAAVAALKAEHGLAGVIEGDARSRLAPLQAQARLGVPLEIPCGLLIRLDFVAAGTLLNWAAEMQGQGHQLRFTQLNHVVAVLLQVIGLSAHARLELRQV